MRWTANRPIRVALRRIDRAFLGRRKLRAEAALTQAIRALNSAGAGFRLARVGPGVPAEIEIFFLGLRSGDTISATGIDGFDGMTIEQTASLVVSDPDSNRLTHAAIGFSTALDTPDFEARMLTELTRAMGLTTPVAGRAYQDVSVLAAAGSDLTRLAPADIAALRRHYAPGPLAAPPIGGTNR